MLEVILVGSRRSRSCTRTSDTRCCSVRLRACGAHRREYPPSTPFVSLVIAAYNEQDTIAAKIENSLALDYPAGSLRDHRRERRLDRRDRRHRARVREHGRSCSAQRRARREDRGDQSGDRDDRQGRDRRALGREQPLRRRARCAPWSRRSPTRGSARHAATSTSSTATGRLGESEGTYWKYEGWIKEQETRLGSTVAVLGEVLAIRRELFEPAPENVINDDHYIALRILKRGYRVVYAPDAISRERVSATAEDEIARRTRMVAGLYQTLVRPRQLFPWKRPVVCWQLVSHKFMRPLVPLWMIAVLATNVALVLRPVRQCGSHCSSVRWRSTSSRSSACRVPPTIGCHARCTCRHSSSAATSPRCSASYRVLDRSAEPVVDPDPEAHVGGRLTIIGYHNLEPTHYFEAADGDGTRGFRRQLQLMRRTMHVISLGDAMRRWSEGRELPMRSVVHHVRRRLPRLPRRRRAAARSVRADRDLLPDPHVHLGRGHRLVGAPFVVRTAATANEVTWERTTHTSSAIARCARQLVEDMAADLKYLDRVERELAVERYVEQLAPAGRIPRRPLPRLGRMPGTRAAGIRDRLALDPPRDPLPGVPGCDQRDDLARSKHELERELDVTIDGLAYPNGDHGDFSSDDVRRAARHAGYTHAVTTIPGTNRPTTAPFELRRVVISPVSGPRGLLEGIARCWKPRREVAA